MTKLTIASSQGKNFQNHLNPFSGSIWKEKWKKCTGKNFGRCSYYGCGKDADIGGLLYLHGHGENYVFVAPICHACSTCTEKNNSYSNMKNDVIYMKFNKTDLNTSKRILFFIN